MTINTIMLFGVLLAMSMSCDTQAETFELPSDIQFIGTVIDTTPNWQWWLHSSAKERAKGWDTEQNKGIKESNGLTRFTYSSKNSLGRIAFIQGAMKTAGSFGRAELLPTVTIIDASGQALTLNGNTDKQRTSIVATGTLSDGQITEGVVSFDIESAYAVQYKKRGDETNFFRVSYDNPIGWAAASVLIENQPAEYANNDNGMKMTSQDNFVASTFSIASLLNGDTTPVSAYSILGGFSSHISEVNTIWEKIPETWTATLTAEVQIP